MTCKELNLKLIELVPEIKELYEDEVIILSILENLFYQQDDIDKFKDFLGDLSKKLFNQFKL